MPSVGLGTRGFLKLGLYGESGRVGEWEWECTASICRASAQFLPRHRQKRVSFYNSCEGQRIWCEAQIEQSIIRQMQHYPPPLSHIKN